MEDVRAVFAWPYKAIVKMFDVSYSTVMRWKNRLKRSEPVIKKRGPKKVKPLDIEGLEKKILNLNHNKKRTQGVGALYAKCKDGVSRRDFNALVEEARKEANQIKIENMRRIEWKAPGLVWAMDDTEYGKDPDGRKLFINNTQDLASRYKFKPKAGKFARGSELAKHLDNLFNRQGAPLFMKRDNGKNLNHKDVNVVLSKHGVIPINSPKYYPPYNGAIEKSQAEVKEGIGSLLGDESGIPREHFKAYVESAVHERNHVPRRSLKGKNSCEYFFGEKNKMKFNKRKRREIFEWIKKLSCGIMEKLKSHSKKNVQLAWRIAAETWLLKNGFINVSFGERVSPTFL